MQPFQCDLQPQLQETHRTTHTGPTIVAKHIEGTKRPQPHPPHTRGTFHRRLQPLYTEKRKVSCSGFLPTSPLAFVTASLPHHFPSSPPRFVTTSLPHHFPSSPLSFLTTPLPHHSPSSSLPFVTTSLRPLPFLTTSLPLHSPSSPLPFIITSLPIVPTSLPHHFPSSPLPFVTTFLRHHPVIITTLHQDQFQRFFFFCYVLLCVVLLCDLPPFIKVNSTASYSFVMYCYVMYCYVIYHPSSFQVSEFYLSVTRKYCFPTSFDHQYTSNVSIYTIHGWYGIERCSAHFSVTCIAIGIFRSRPGNSSECPHFDVLRSMAISGTDWLEVPIPYIFGLFFRPKFQEISPQFRNGLKDGVS